MIDELPEEALQRAEQALKYCANPAETRLTIGQAKERVRAMSMKCLEEHSKRTGHGFITGIGSGSGATMPTGDFNSSMIAWDDGPVTYHLRRFSGYMFEMYESLELAKDGKSLVLAQRIVGPNGTEQRLTANMPVPDSAAGQ
jgi:hypothetical protein